MLTKAISLRWYMIAGVMLLLSCAQPVTKPVVDVVPVSPRPIAALIDSTTLSTSGYFAAPTTKWFYTWRRFRPAWYVSDHIIPAADSLIRMVLVSGKYGLLPGDYHAKELQKLSGATAIRNADSLTRAEILLTDAFFALAHHLGSGRMDPSGTSRLLRQTIPDTTSAKLLENVLDNQLSTRPALESREPSAAAYRELKIRLQDLLMRSTGDGDSALVRDSLVKLSINMERWRWENRSIPEKYILVNIPAFELYVMEADRVVLQSRVIVGTLEKQTPLLTSQIECFVIYPYWTVPRSIATEEFLPRIQTDSTFLPSHNFDVLSRKWQVLNADTIQWSRYSKDNFPFRLRQREGDDNTLGIIKYIFDNRYGVYLHDTNEKRLFRRTARTFSHGCIRMEKARELAHYLIRSRNARYDEAELEELFKKRERAEVGLVHREPILIRYFTCGLSQGRIQFYEDCYNLDTSLIRAIYRH